MILRRYHLDNGFTIGKSQYTCLFSEQQLFDHHFGSGTAECSAEALLFDKIFGTGTVLGDQHTLTGCQAVGFDNDTFGSGIKLGIDVVTSGLRILKGFRSRGGNTVFDHEFFGEILTAFQLGGNLIRSENFQISRFEYIHDTGAKRSFRTDNCQIDFFFFCEVSQFFQLVNFNVDAFGISGDSGITGGAKNFFYLRTAFQLPHQCVLATAGTDYQNFFHFSLRSLLSTLLISVSTNAYIFWQS